MTILKEEQGVMVFENPVKADRSARNEITVLGTKLHYEARTIESESRSFTVMEHLTNKMLKEPAALWRIYDPEDDCWAIIVISERPKSIRNARRILANQGSIYQPFIEMIEEMAMQRLEAITKQRLRRG